MSPTVRSVRTEQEPGEAVFSRMLSTLVKRRDPIGVIRLVERQALSRSIGRVERLAEAEAFLDLHLMDRAWVRLREATEADPNDVEALALTARMFLARGWPARARKTLERLERLAPAHPDLAGLQDQAALPAPTPLANERELERTGSPSELLALARQYLTSGSMIRGRSLLERLRRLSPEDSVVRALLWGLRGEFVDRELRFEDLVAELFPPAEVGEWDQAESTENVRAADLLGADPPTAEVASLGRGDRLSRTAFPSLFRGSEGSEKGGRLREEDEVTMTSHMASVEEMVDPPPEERTDSAVLAHEEEDADTRIMQVIQSSAGQPQLVEVDGPMHRQGGGKDPLRETLDLKAWQASMGMPAGEEGRATGIPEEDDLLEEEDHDLVVMTRREEAPASPERVLRREPIEVIEKVPVPVARPIPPPVARRPPRQEPRRGQIDEDEMPPRSGMRPRSWGLLLAGLALLLLLMIAAAALAIKLIQTLTIENLHARTRPALAAGDYEELLEVEAELLAAVGDADPLSGIRASELSLIEGVLWSEYTGDRARLGRAEEMLHHAERQDAPEADRALAETWLALGRGQLDRADKAAESLDLSDEAARHALASLALEEGHLVRAREVWGEGPGSGARYRILDQRLRLALEGGEGEVDPQLLAAAPQDVLLALAAVELGWSREPPEARLLGLDSLLARGGALAPRLAARIHIQRAVAFQELGEDAEAIGAWQTARALDGSNPVTLSALGADALAHNRVLAALTDFEACLAEAPMRRRCERGEIQALLDLDRVDEARVVVEASANADRPDLFGAWVLWSAGEQGEAEARLATFAAAESAMVIEDRALLAWLQAAVTPDEDPNAPARWRYAVERLAASPNPLDRILEGRAQAALLACGEGRISGADARAALAQTARDPVALVTVGLYLDRAGQPRTAAEAMDLAAQVGPENALALQQRGLFYYEPPSYERAMESWRRYLDLGPTGVRADRVRQRVERR